MAKFTLVDQDFQDTRSWLLAYVEDVRQSLYKTKADVLTEEDHLGSSFEAIVICEAIEECLAVAELRLRLGSPAEQSTIAAMLGHYKRIVAITSTTPMLVKVADGALRAASSRQGTPGGVAKTEKMRAEAERVRDLIEAATRKPDGAFKHPGDVLKRVCERLNRPDLDRKTLKNYREYIDGSEQTDTTLASSGRAVGTPT